MREPSGRYDGTSIRQTLFLPPSPKRVDHTNVPLRLALIARSPAQVTSSPAFKSIHFAGENEEEDAELESSETKKRFRLRGSVILR